MKVFRGHRYLYHSSNIMLLGYFKDRYQNLECNICCSILFFFWAWLQKHVIKPPEECHIPSQKMVLMTNIWRSTWLTIYYETIYWNTTSSGGKGGVIVCLNLTSLLFYSNSSQPSGELDANRPVPFRLTPPLQSFITQIGITGPFQMTMLAAARCLVQPCHSLDSILRAVLRDEMIAWKKVRGREVYTCTVKKYCVLCTTLC
jgi:hypothetical protein